MRYYNRTFFRRRRSNRHTAVYSRRHLQHHGLPRKKRDFFWLDKIKPLEVHFAADFLDRRKSGGKLLRRNHACSLNHFCTSSAAIQPKPAAVMACLYRLSWISPPVNMPGMLVLVKYLSTPFSSFSSYLLTYP